MIAQIEEMEQIQTKKDWAYSSPELKSEAALLKSSIPYFERNGFVKEEVSMRELFLLHEMGFTKMTEDDLIEAKTALNVIGYNPAIKLVNVMIENDVLGFSRPGIDNHPHLKFLASLLPKLKKEGGATHLALMLPKSLQRLLDAFTATGKIFANLSPFNLEDYGLKGDNDFTELLKAARLAGYHLVAVEPEPPANAFDARREQIVARSIQTILESNNRAKIILIAHDRHLNYMTVGEWMPVACILKESGLSISTVNQFWHSEFIPKVFGCLLNDLNQPIALASKDVKMFSALQSASLSFEEALPSNWDITIIYPKATLPKARSFRLRIRQMAAVFSHGFPFFKRAAAFMPDKK